MTDSEKIDRILRLCEGMANTLVEHSVELKFLHSQVDIHSEDAATFASRLRDVKGAVEQLDKIAKGQDARLRENRDDIRELKTAQKRRANGNGTHR